MQAIWNGAIIAESDDIVVVENNRYFPADAVAMEYLKESDKTYECSWKGTATYFHVIVGDMVNEDAAWTYRNPKEAAQEIKGRISFWNGVEVVE